MTKKTLYAGNTAHCTDTERAIADRRNLIVLLKKGIIAEDVDEKARTKSENQSAVECNCVPQ